MVRHDRQVGKKPQPTTYTQVIVGGISGMTITLIVHPLDLVKVRLQLYPRSCTTFALARRIVRCEGVSALYNGLSAGIMRQATYTTTRLAVYYMLYENYMKVYGIPCWNDKMLIGLYAGLAGAMAGNPSEVVLVRMMASTKWDPCTFKECKRSKLYNGLFDAFYKIATTEGVCALWRGGALTMTRSALVSIVHVQSYAWAIDKLIEKQIVLREGDAKLHIIASVVSAIPTALVTLPVDTIKTKYQVRSDQLSQEQVLNCTFRIDGIRFMYQGLTPYFIRLSVHTILAHLILEKFSDLYAWLD